GRLRERAGELLRAGSGDRADVANDLVPRHPDAVVDHGERSRLAVEVDANARLAGGAELALRQLLEPELVERVGCVRDQLAQEDVAIRVERMDHEVEQLLDLGLELVTCRRLAHTDQWNKSALRYRQADAGR